MAQGKKRRPNPYRPSLRLTPEQRNFADIIRAHGGTVLSDHDTGYWYRGKQVSSIKCRALIKKGVLIGRNDGLFQDAPAQTYEFAPSCLR